MIEEMEFWRANEGWCGSVFFFMIFQFFEQILMILPTKLGIPKERIFFLFLGGGI